MHSNNCKFVGLELSNPNWQNIGKLIESKYHQYIELSKCGSWGKLYEPEPHITLYYNEDNDKGPNWMYWLTTVYGRDLYMKLKNNLILKFNKFVIDTFRNDDAIVLKIDVIKSDCDQFDPLKQYHDLIESNCIPGKFKDYNPHITITYLKPNTDQSIIDQIVSDIKSIPSIRTYEITSIMLGGGEDSGFKSSKLPII